ncbi:hypothetical protein HPP92_016733 [Vanilla planifolia]|uniref:Uncharacterized protein n=1 Tax=Vanilla planifolia TaxID=51239 RepID=A0A835UQD3_VANPL|nr:hypothetical protein HPP92_016733 [Vanilla planifolia]
MEQQNRANVHVLELFPPKPFFFGDLSDTEWVNEEEEEEEEEEQGEVVFLRKLSFDELRKRSKFFSRRFQLLLSLPEVIAMGGGDGKVLGVLKKPPSPLPPPPPLPLKGERDVDTFRLSDRNNAWLSLPLSRVASTIAMAKGSISFPKSPPPRQMGDRILTRLLGGDLDLRSPITGA